MDSLPEPPKTVESCQKWIVCLTCGTRLRPVKQWRGRTAVETEECLIVPALIICKKCGAVRPFIRGVST